MASQEHDIPQAALDREDSDALAARLRTLVAIKDRKYGFPAKTYPKCFVGTEAVRALIADNIAADEDDAVRLGNMLLSAGVFHHVVKEHPFKNEELFYRFASDEDHGEVAKKADGRPVSWSDFLAPVTSEAAVPRSLQPSIPERDPNLGDFAQDDLDTIGVSPLDVHNTALLDCVHPKAWVSPSPKPSYNLVVIGAGSGGLVTAAGAAGVGARVALVESHLLGGDCLNVGCVPSKALIRCARAAAAVREAGEFGVKVDGPVSVDFPAVMERMRRLRARIAPHDSAERFSKELGVDVFIGRARFTGESTVEVNGETLTFSKAVIATGGSAAVPPIPGLADAPFLTNATVFNLTDFSQAKVVMVANNMLTTTSLTGGEDNTWAMGDMYRTAHLVTVFALSGLPGTDVNVTQRQGSQAETAIAINPTDPLNMIIGVNDSNALTGIFGSVSSNDR